MSNGIVSFARAGRPRPILLAPHPSLTRKAKPVERKTLRDPLFVQLVADLFATSAANALVGMGAPQVGALQRLIIVDFAENGTRFGPYAIINPVLEMREGELLSTEGSPCLPGLIADIVRAEHVICTGLAIDGSRVCLDATGMLAICLQHEVDHLEGILIDQRAVATRLAPPAAEDTGTGTTKERLPVPGSPLLGQF